MRSWPPIPKEEFSMNTVYKEVMEEIQVLSSEIHYLVRLVESLKREVDRFVEKVEEIKL